MYDSAKIKDILAAFQRDLSDGESPKEALRMILDVTSARAVGLWRYDENELAQLGFCAAHDMPAEVRDAFAEATRRVPLGETGLGIVKAVRTEAPALADLDSQTTVLPTSANWLTRFEARRSLAVPTTSQNAVNGALAVSTANDLAPDGDVWNSMCQLASELGGCLDADNDR